MSFVLRNSPPPVEKKKHREKFPAKTCLTALLLAVGLYWYAVCALPALDPGISPSAKLAVTLGKKAASQPLIVALVLAVGFLPAVVKRYGVRAYLLRLAVLLFILLGGLYAVAEHPFERVGDTVQGWLSLQRTVPH